MTESLRTLDDVPRARRPRRAAAALEEVGIDEPGQAPAAVPPRAVRRDAATRHDRHRVAVRASLLLADECTTALDVTTQSEVMAVLDDLRRDRGLAMLFITHDLELAGAVCDRTWVMYAGQVVETRAADQLHADPLHPYSAALVQARPDIALDRPAARRHPRAPGLGVRGTVGLPVRAALSARAGLVPRRTSRRSPSSTAGGCGASASELRGQLLEAEAHA